MIKVLKSMPKIKETVNKIEDYKPGANRTMIVDTHGQARGTL